MVFHSFDEIRKPHDKTSAADLQSPQTVSNKELLFHQDGFLCFSQLLTPEFISQLRRECLEIFEAVMQWLMKLGEIDFASASRIRNEKINKSIHHNEDVSKMAVAEKYEYPLGVGVKNGYKELVMRSFGRYELLLLVDDHLITKSLLGNDDRLYGGRRLIYSDMFQLPKQLHVGITSETSTKINQFHRTRRDIDRLKSNQEKVGKETSNNKDLSGKYSHNQNCLQLILKWIHENNNGSHNPNNPVPANQQQEAHCQNQRQIQRLMDFVTEIFSSIDGFQDNRDNHKNNDGFYLLNMSLILATPGCPSQSWHADGGHVSLDKHEPCHCLNVFLPLIDLPLTMGPTELRPGSHYYTRDLTRMMLVAKAKKELRPPVVPELCMGDALIFDYRILHRGRANVSDVAGVDIDNARIDTQIARAYNEFHSREDSVGRDRPILVLTFAKSWFVDVCNFPKNSLFHYQSQECSLCS